MKIFTVNYGNNSITFDEVEEIPTDTCGNYIRASSQEELEDTVQQWAVSYDADVTSANFDVGYASIYW